MACGWRESWVIGYEASKSEDKTREKSKGDKMRARGFEPAIGNFACLFLINASSICLV